MSLKALKQQLRSRHTVSKTEKKPEGTAIVLAPKKESLQVIDNALTNPKARPQLMVKPVQQAWNAIQARRQMQGEITLFYSDATAHMRRWLMKNRGMTYWRALEEAELLFDISKKGHVNQALKERRTDAAEKLMDELQQKYDMPDYLDAKFRTQYVDTFPDLKTDIPSFEGYPYQEEVLIRFIYERQELSEDGAKFAARKMIEDGAGLMPEDHAVYLEYERKEKANG